MPAKVSRFDIWWNSPEVKQKVGAAYSIGASVVIIGAMFKILHLPMAAEMLGIGMTVEAFLFALGIFDQPHKDYDWEKVYDFEGDEKGNSGVGTSHVISPNRSQTASHVITSVVEKVVPQETAQSRAVGLNYSETINDEDVKKLSEGIKNLTTTAKQFAGLSDVVGATEQFVKTIDGASQVTGKYINNQESLNGAAVALTNSYQSISGSMESVEKSTKLYSGKMEDINKNLSSINSIYEIQLKNIQAQTEGITQQTERVRTVNVELGAIATDVQRMKAATLIAADETENYKVGTVKLAKQVADLNHVYGNMLNALN